MPHIAIIATLGARARALGKNNELLWHLPEDLKHFKELTTGHPVIMGRKTWESLPEKVRPLPSRTNIIVTRDPVYEARGASVAGSLVAAIEKARESDGAGEIFVIGGGEIYAAALPYADRLYLTLVDDDAEGDVFFPPYEAVFTHELSREEQVSPSGIKYAWVELTRGES